MNQDFLTTILAKHKAMEPERKLVENDENFKLLVQELKLVHERLRDHRTQCLTLDEKIMADQVRQTV